jgi:hypothetical protein
VRVHVLQHVLQPVLQHVGVSVSVVVLRKKRSVSALARRVVVLAKVRAKEMLLLEAVARVVSVELFVRSCVLVLVLVVRHAVVRASVSVTKEMLACVLIQSKRV